MKVMSLFVACAALLVNPRSVSAQSPCPSQRTIAVTGTAEVKTIPDQVVLTVGVQSRDRDLKVARTQNDTRVKQALAEARAAGVDSKDLQVSEFRMDPRYSDDKAERLLGYEVSQDITITLKDLSKYDSLMTALVESGINHVGGIAFGLASSRKFKDEARALAIRAAREKAVAMAAELGQTVGKPMQIEEVSADSPFYSQMIQANQRTVVAPGGEPMGVASGQVVASASVRVVFLLE
jgi:uncharacterized protein